jgi:hypothetical protein
MSFPRSFILLKLSCLAFFVLVHIADFRWNRHFRIHARILIFYCCVAFGGLTWSLVGLMGAGEPAGVMDNLRLYVGWSMAWVLILTLLRNDNGLRYLHSSLVISGLLIAVINLYGMYDVYAQVGLISKSIMDELHLSIGFHDGYVQVSSHNIGPLLVITPYLLAIQLCRNVENLNGKLTKLSLLACILVSALSGRRALWLCIALTPLIIGLLAVMSGSLRAIKPSAQKLIAVMVCGLGFALIVLVATNAQPGESGIAVVDHLSAAFSSEDERAIQSGYLVSSFTNQPLFGSGFGAYAGYLRNSDFPWLYELTYFQLLFNCGLVGLLYWSMLTGTYLFFVFRVIRENTDHTGQPLCLIVGLFSFLIGAYSNPYLGSFDFLIYVALLPYVASLRGMTRSAHGVTDGRRLDVDRQEDMRLGA